MDATKYNGKGYWDFIRIKNKDTNYPSNMGQKWNNEEESMLLEEINNNTDIEIIAQKHGRTIGGITSRLRKIAYEMYLNNISIEEIIKLTKLEHNCIEQIIQKKK